MSCDHLWQYVGPAHSYPAIGIDWSRTCNPPVHTHDEYGCMRCLAPRYLPLPQWVVSGQRGGTGDGRAATWKGAPAELVEDWRLGSPTPDLIPTRRRLVAAGRRPQLPDAADPLLIVSLPR